MAFCVRVIRQFSKLGLAFLSNFKISCLFFFFLCTHKYVLLYAFLVISKIWGLLSVSSVSLHSMRGVTGTTLQGIMMNMGKPGLLTNSGCLWNVVILCVANRNVKHNFK